MFIEHLCEFVFWTVAIGSFWLAVSTLVGRRLSAGRRGEQWQKLAAEAADVDDKRPVSWRLRGVLAGVRYILALCAWVGRKLPWARRDEEAKTTCTNINSRLRRSGAARPESEARPLCVSRVVSGTEPHLSGVQ